MILAIYIFAILIVLILLFGLVTVLVNSITVRHFDDYPLAHEYPFVSVLVPARNEEKNIEACVRSLLEQDYPHFEVIVLNDNSTDETPQILERLSSESSQLRVINGAPLAENWLGKHWACHQLAQVAQGELILFTDADTRHAPGMLKASVSALLAERADLVTALPCEEMFTWGERFLVPIIGWGIFTFIPIRMVQKLHIAWVSITIGQFMLFRRSSFDGIGGYEAVKNEFVDDICLGRRIIDNGYEWRFLNGTRHISCHMYSNFTEAIEGFSKILFAVFDFRIVPYVLGWLLVGISFLEPVVVITLHWLFPLLTLPFTYAVISVALSIVLFLIVYWNLRIPLFILPFFPLSLLFFIFLAARSMLWNLNGTTTWKGRKLDRAAIHWF